MNEDPDRLDGLERELQMIIDTITRDYHRQIEPYVRRLAHIRALRPPPPIILTPDEEQRIKRWLVVGG